MRLSLLLVFFISLHFFAQQTPNVSILDLKEIMKGYDFIGHPPQNIQWSPDGNHLYYQIKTENAGVLEWYQYSLSSQKTQKVTPDQLLIFHDPKQSAFSKSFHLVNNAIIGYDKTTQQSKTLYNASPFIQNIQRVNHQDHLVFLSNNNLFAMNTSNFSFNQITNFQTGSSPKINTEQNNFITQQETELFDFIKLENKKKELYKNQQYNQSIKLPKPIYLNGKTLENLQVSPNQKFVTFLLSEYPKNQSTLVTHYIAEDGQTYVQEARPQVGILEAKHQLLITNLSNDSSITIHFSSLSAIRKKPDYLNDSKPYESDRPIAIHELIFAPNGNTALCEIKSYDNKERWIVLIDLQTGTIDEIDHQHDEAWIGGPGISGWNQEMGTLGWFDKGQKIYFQSEKTGYSHLYAYDLKKKEKSALTTGNWEVHQVYYSEKSNEFYIHANRSHPGNRDFLKLNPNTKTFITILNADGAHEVLLSPNEKSLACRYSYSNQPWELYLGKNIEKTSLIQITNQTSPSFKKYPWRQPEVVTFKGEDGVEVYARLYKPNEKIKNKAAIMFVHGAGYLQNAHNYWSSYYREYLFHNMLCDNGYTVIDIDYRASEGYGRDYRTAIYRHMGNQDLKDYITGKNYLVKNLNIDSNKVGIYGGSYGGFITLMALLKNPGTFKCGAALRSVTDWSHYNHEYTSNILNTPDTDPKAYQRSSPLYFAQNLKDHLLMLHGMVDDNVQYQDVVRLSQRFIELGKENWELAIYPIESHTFEKNTSWQDEYRRIYELFYRTLIRQQ